MESVISGESAVSATNLDVVLVDFYVVNSGISTVITVGTFFKFPFFNNHYFSPFSIPLTR